MFGWQLEMLKHVHVQYRKLFLNLEIPEEALRARLETCQSLKMLDYITNEIKKRNTEGIGRKEVTDQSRI